MTSLQIHEFFTKPKNVLLVALCLLAGYAIMFGDQATFDKIFSVFTKTLETLPAAAPQNATIIQG